MAAFLLVIHVGQEGMRGGLNSVPTGTINTYVIACHYHEPIYFTQHDIMGYSHFAHTFVMNSDL